MAGRGVAKNGFIRIVLIGALRGRKTHQRVSLGRKPEVEKGPIRDVF